jgi:hypothetical protein
MTSGQFRVRVVDYTWHIVQLTSSWYLVSSTLQLPQRIFSVCHPCDVQCQALHSVLLPLTKKEKLILYHLLTTYTGKLGTKSLQPSKNQAVINVCLVMGKYILMSSLSWIVHISENYKHLFWKEIFTTFQFIYWRFFHLEETLKAKQISFTLQGKELLYGLPGWFGTTAGIHHGNKLHRWNVLLNQNCWLFLQLCTCSNHFSIRDGITHIKSYKTGLVELGTYLKDKFIWGFCTDTLEWKINKIK